MRYITICCLLFYLSAPEVAPAQETESSGAQTESLTRPEQFMASLHELEQQVTRRRWPQVLRSTKRLLSEHAGADYVLPHLQGLREEFRRAAFWESAVDPDPKDLVAGELLRYVPSKGSIKIRYTEHSISDFETYGEGLIHPMHFNGPWSVSIRGIPRELANWSYFLEAAPSEGYSMTFGARIKGQRQYTRHNFEQVRGLSRLSLKTESPKEFKKVHAKAKAKIEVNAREIRIGYAGGSVFKRELRNEAIGRFGLVPVLGRGRWPFGEVTIEGTIDPGWIGGLIDEALAEQRVEFFSTWKAPKEFDAWKANREVRVEDLSIEQMLDNLLIKTQFDNKEQEELHAKMAGKFFRGTLQSILASQELAELPDGALSRSSELLLGFYSALSHRNYPGARGIFDLLEIEPGSELSRGLMRAELLRLEGRIEESCEAYRVIARQNPQTSLAHQRCAELLLLQAKPSAAHEVVLAGRKELPFSKTLRDLEVKIVKAEKGPDWEKSFESFGRHFLVRTDVDRELAKKARRVADEAWQRCAKFFRPLKVATSKLPGLGEESETSCHSIIYLFSGQSGYLRFVEGMTDGSQENTRGLYNIYLKHIAAWNHPNINELWQTLRHEIAHRYLDLALGERIPRWLNEGLAQDFAATWNHGSGEHLLGIDWEAAAVLGNLKTLPEIDSFFFDSDSEFMADAETNYALAWAFVHVLNAQEDPKRNVMVYVLNQLQEGVEPFQVMINLAEMVDAEQFSAAINSILLLQKLQDLEDILERKR